MESTPATLAAPAAVSNDPELERLQAKAAEGSGDALKLSADVHAYIKTHRIEPIELARKLGKSRTWMVQLLGFSDMGQDVLQNIKDIPLSYGECQSLRALPKDLRLQVSEKIKSGELRIGHIIKRCQAISVQNPAASPIPAAANTETDETNSPNPTNNETNTEFEGYPLLRDTVDELMKLSSFWRQKFQTGRILERWLIKARETGWFKTGFLVVFMGFSFYGVYQGSTEIWHKARDIYFRLQAQPGAGGAGGTAAGRPEIIDHYLLAGNRLRLTWSSAGPNMSYRVYYQPTNADFDDPLGQDVSTPGAIVDINPTWKKALITVTAIAPNGVESAHSNAITFLLKPENQSNTVTPLEEGEQDQGTEANQNGGSPGQRLTGRAAKGRSIMGNHSPRSRSADVSASGHSGQPPSSPPAPRVIVPAHTEVHYELKTPDLIYITWRPVGPPGLYAYNVYSFAKADMSSGPRKENTAPIKSTVVTWTPETGLETYWVVITAVDAQGNESSYSEVIQIVRHPEKSGNSALLDQAAGAVKKVLPW